MFTGIVQTTGTVVSLNPAEDDVCLKVKAGEELCKGLSLGDSVSVSGACLTVVNLTPDTFSADVSVETMKQTIIGRFASGDKVNLETALTLNALLGGHLVTGHVDGVGELLERQSEGRSERMRFSVPESLSRYIARKGSVCVDGVSLTVNDVKGSEFEVNIVPHTLVETTLGAFRPGRHVNIEVDIIARYLERLLVGKQGHDADVGDSISYDLLQRFGYIRKG